MAWEIFNEPEGVTKVFGWTDQRTDMAHIQQFVNLLAGAIHRADPDALVTNGTWNLQVLTDVDGMTNYYTDDRLIAAGGDTDGTLDFYETHYYPQYFDEKTSPFHNPYSHWELDKPLVIGEFPAKAIANLGAGFKPKHQLRNSMESYEYLLKNGYAGALAWTFYESEFGKMLDATPGILRVNNLAPDHVKVDIGNVDHIPVVQQAIENVVAPISSSAVDDYVNLNDIFRDAEDAALIYSITENSEPELVNPVVNDAGMLSLNFPSGKTGTSSLEVTATDSVGHYSRVQFVVQVIDPDRGNVALGKKVLASTIENVGFPAGDAVDGLPNTRWSTEYTDGQWLDVDLGKVFTVSEVILRWEAAYGAQYDIQVWDGSAWKTVYSEPAGDGKIDDIALDAPVDARYIRMNGMKRGTEWGFSLYEFEVYGVATAAGDAVLETVPPDEANTPVVENTAEVVASNETLFNSFETDVEGWQLSKDWAGGKGINVSTDQANEGKQSLALQVSFTGGGTWQEAGTAFDPEGGADWTSSTQLAMDVYVPEGAESFIAQIFMKTSDGWAWANSADNPLTPGQWTTAVADLSTMGDLKAVKEFGIKIGTSVTAFDGAILIDNVRLISPAAVSAAEGSTTSVSTTPVEAEVNAIRGVTALEDTVGVYDKLELVADIDAVFNNPYDPSDIRVDGRFISPSGETVIVPGFYYREFKNDAGNLTPTNDWSWRVRFTPTEVGEWQYQVLATTLKGTKRSDSGTFTASESDNPGFIRIDSRNPRYFAFDNGTPYYPIGEDMAWSTGNPLIDYPKWLDKLHAAGGNFIRVWMASWGFGIEWVDTGLGNYDKRQVQAYELDQLMDMAADRDVYIMLSLLNHGAFNTTTNPEWDQNPYNAANGGPCAEPTCFGTDPTAIRYWHQRLRYIAARWGYSPNIMSWEWWNEINWTGLVSLTILVPWVEQSASYLQSLDPYDHLITHSGSPEGDKKTWGLDSLDFTQDHQYGLANLPLTYSQIIPNWLRDYPNKPFLMGEFGGSAGGASSTDTQGVTLHQGIWSAPMNGAAGSAMTWWWDNYVDPLDLYYQFSGLSAFLKGEDLAAQEWKQTGAEVSGTAKANIYGMQSDTSALLWVVNTDYGQSYMDSAYMKALRDALRAQSKAQALYSFEGDLNGWVLVKDWADGKEVGQGDMASDGDGSLALNASYSGGGTWQEAGAAVQPEGGADWSQYTRVSMEIYVPEGAAAFTAQVYTKTGDNWTWTNSPDNALSAGRWNTLTIQLDGMGDLTAIREFGVKIGSSTGVLDGAFLIDNIRLGGGQPKVVVEFPEVDGASVTVTDLQPGNYTVEVWDPTAGTVLATSDIESTDGTAEIALPTFSTDLAIKVKPQS